MNALRYVRLYINSTVTFVAEITVRENEMVFCELTGNDFCQMSGWVLITGLFKV
jgi:hypothetical protein